MDPSTDQLTDGRTDAPVCVLSSPSMRFLVMVLKAESARHMLAAGVNRDDVICENVIKMGTLAQSALSHGVSTMLANLSSSLSIDRNAHAEATAMTPFVLLRTKREDSDLRFTHFEENASVSDDASVSVKSKSWLHEYYEGAAKEMYLIHLSKVRRLHELSRWLVTVP